MNITKWTIVPTLLLTMLVGAAWAEEFDDGYTAPGIDHSRVKTLAGVSVHAGVGFPYEMTDVEYSFDLKEPERPLVPGGSLHAAAAWRLGLAHSWAYVYPDYILLQASTTVDTWREFHGQGEAHSEAHTFVDFTVNGTHDFTASLLLGHFGESDGYMRWQLRELDGVDGKSPKRIFGPSFDLEGDFFGISSIYSTMQEERSYSGKLLSGVRYRLELWILRFEAPHLRPYDIIGPDTQGWGGLLLQVTPGVELAMEALTDDVLASVSNEGIAEALAKKIQSATWSAFRGKTRAARGNLQAFINQVNAQRGKSISSTVADEMIAEAQAILDQVDDG